MSYSFSFNSTVFKLLREKKIQLHIFYLPLLYLYNGKKYKG